MTPSERCEAHDLGLQRCSRTLLVGEAERRFLNGLTHQPAHLPHAVTQLHGTRTRVDHRLLTETRCSHCCHLYHWTVSFSFLVLTALCPAQLAREDVSCRIWRRVYELLCSGSQSRRDWNCRQWIQRSMYTVSTISQVVVSGVCHGVWANSRNVSWMNPVLFIILSEANNAS